MSNETKEVIFEGLAMYANLPPRPAQKGFESEDTAYSVQIECSEAKFKELKKEGIPPLSQLKEFDGKTYLKLKATKTKTTRDGELLTFNDIPVVDSDGEAITDSIANGSTLKCVASLDEIKGRPGKKVLRLRGVVVTNLIVYEGSDSSNPFKSLGIKPKTATTAPFTADTKRSTSDDIFS